MSINEVSSRMSQNLDQKKKKGLGRCSEAWATS
jgi:hypothetical protein